MKVHSYNVSDVGGGKSILSVAASDRMKRPVRIKITVEQAETTAEAAACTLDRAELGDLLACLARIAWNEFKWRPAQLGAVIAHVVGNLKA